jgi:3-oxoacyl-[acyl-carrier-protein] synthase II
MYITGISWVTAGGTGKSNDPFDIKNGALPPIPGEGFPANAGFRKGRLDRFSLLGLQTVTNALSDAGLCEWDNKRDIGIVASTVYGCLITDLEYYETIIPENGVLPDPNLFAHTLPNIFIGYAAMLFGLTGPNYILYERVSTGLSAIHSAMECILSGECDTMLAGMCDVEPPENATESETPTPGSIFIVIEKSPYPGKRHFGRLSLGSTGNILLDKKGIKDIASCIKECLKRKSG